jgi:hypothetical protein
MNALRKSLYASATSLLVLVSCAQREGDIASEGRLSSVAQAITVQTSGFEAVLFQSGAYDKPIVVFEGFDPGDDMRPFAYWAPSYDATNDECVPALFDLPSATRVAAINGSCASAAGPGSLPAQAAAQGWDVWVVSVTLPQSTMEVWDTAAAYNAQLHDKILTWAGGKSAGPAKPYIMAGLSAGGVIARKSLSLLGARRASDVRAYISFDAPHEGAYIPYSFQQYMLDHAVCGRLDCHPKSVTKGLATGAAASLIKARIVPTECGRVDPGYTWPNFWSDCHDSGGCNLPEDGEWNHCASPGGNGDFTSVVRSPSWFGTQYGGWFTDIPRYAISNSSFYSNYLPPNNLYASRIELLKTDVATWGDDHLYTETDLQPEIRGSLDPFVDALDNVVKRRDWLGYPTVTLHKINNWNFVSFNSAFGVNQGLSWTGRLIGQNLPASQARHTNCTADTVDYLTNVVNATFSGTTHSGLRGPASACGDGSCAGPDNGETSQTCPADCGPYCGDGSCNGSESCSTCSNDCGTCPVGNCCPPGSTCLAGGTDIKMADGSQRNIEDIHVGDRVMSYDTTLGRMTSSEVTKTFAHPAVEGTVLINGKLRATPNHPFYVGGQWKRADELAAGDPLLTLDPRAGEGSMQMVVAPDTVTSLAMMPGTLETYNLEVAGEHDYFAGGVLVHNKTCVVCEQ